MSTHAQGLVHRLIQAINDQDHGALQELVAADYVHRTPGEERTGVEALRELLIVYRRAFPDLELVIDDMFGDAGRVATVFTLNGTHLGELMGVPGTGARVSVRGVIHSRVESGRIAEEWELLDLAGLYRQLGLAEG
jgi:steroid delta-isomerase-like uncharacterized protein